MPADDLGSVGSSVLRSGLATNLLWIGTLEFNLAAALLTAAESLRAARR